MEVLSYVAERGDTDANKVLTEVRKPIRERLSKGINIAESLIKKIYGEDRTGLKPQEKTGTLFQSQKLIARNDMPVDRPNDALRAGCLQTGETKFGCLHLQQTTDDWPGTVKQQMLTVAKASGVTIDLNHIYHSGELPERDMARRRFWNEIAEQNIRTMLVVSPMLGQRKTQLRSEALQAGIALQFMRPMGLVQTQVTL